jgi:hypothetical protein
VLDQHIAPDCGFGNHPLAARAHLELAFKVAAKGIVEIDVIADSVRLYQLDLALLD